jgi:hypothetical protein
MSEPFIIDAHAHTGAMNLFFCPESSARQLLARMDRQGIRQCVNAGGWTYMLMGGRKGLEELRRQHL